MTESSTTRERLAPPAVSARPEPRPWHRLQARDAVRALPIALAALAIAVLFFWEVRAAGSVTVDDAYITFSFSKNLAQGHGPLYGHGVRVEGYSNFLWMVAVAIGLALGPRGADPVAVAHGVGLPFLGLLGYAVYRLARLRAGPVLSLAILGVLALDSDVTTAFQIGLETLPYTALICLGFLLYARMLEGGAGRRRVERWVIPVFTLVALTRIDGFIPLGFVLAFEAARRLIRRDGTPLDYVKWAAPGVLVYLAWFAWRFAYYGLPLPTTYYAKALIPKLLPERGYAYLRDELTSTGLLVFVPFALILAVTERRIAWPLVLFVALHAYYVTLTGGDWMPYGRFVLPIVPLALVLIAWEGQELVELFRARLGRARFAALALPFSALWLFVYRTERHLTEEPAQKGKFAFVVDQRAHVTGLIEAAQLLNYALPPGARLVTDYGGVLAYYTDSAPIEMWGLCNAAIATRGGTERINPIYGRTCPECYPELHPDFFHVMQPIVRGLHAFRNHGAVVRGVWQTDTIGRYIDFWHDFVSGRVMRPAQNQAVYFLERRKPNQQYRPRRVTDTVLVDYPFEPGGRSPGL